MKCANALAPISVLISALLFTASAAGATAPPASPDEMAAEVRGLVTRGAGVLMPDLDAAYIKDDGFVPLGEGDFPAMFLYGLVAELRDGVAVFPVEVRLDDETGDACFLNALGEPFWHVPSEVPERYRPWLVADPWRAPSRAGIRWTFAHDAEAALLRAAVAADLADARRTEPLRSLPLPPVTSLCFTGFSHTVMSGCSATGNGGALYVTIRGLLEVVNSTISGCSALNSGTTFDHDWRKVAGMGGAIHVSAGGFCRVSSSENGCVEMDDNSANTSGGAISVKSGRAYLNGTVLMSRNSANGAAIDGYGNGGAIFVTSSLFDDLPPMGAGSAAALLYEEHGLLSRDSGQVHMYSNRANRWGGALYAGISDPWIKQEIVEDPSERCASHMSLSSAELEGNSAEMAVLPDLPVPAHFAFEYVNGSLNLSWTSITGNGTNDIGVLEKGSTHANTNGMSFTNVLVPHCER